MRTATIYYASYDNAGDSIECQLDVEVTDSAAAVISAASGFNKSVWHEEFEPDELQILHVLANACASIEGLAGRTIYQKGYGFKSRFAYGPAFGLTFTRQAVITDQGDGDESPEELEEDGDA